MKEIYLRHSVVPGATNVQSSFRIFGSVFKQDLSFGGTAVLDVEFRKRTGGEVEKCSGVNLRLVRISDRPASQSVGFDGLFVPGDDEFRAVNQHYTQPFIRAKKR